MVIRGSCLCGGVTFEIEQATGPAEYCHCNRCRKISGSSALLMVGVKTKDFRFLTGRELLKSYDAPILYRPPAYRTTFCSNCGSSVPPAEPEGEFFEIPAGLFDDDIGVKPDKHIYVDLAPSWDQTKDQLPRFTMREIFKLRTGRDLPAHFQLKTHGSR